MEDKRSNFIPARHLIAEIFKAASLSQKNKKPFALMDLNLTPPYMRFNKTVKVLTS